MKNCKFDIIKIIDDFKWKKENKNTLYDINYSHGNLKPEEKILTHWLCYIVDRGKKFEEIWDVGGFVLSDMVYNYYTKSLDYSNILNPNNQNSMIYFHYKKDNDKKDNDKKDNDKKDNDKKDNDKKDSDKKDSEFYFRSKEKANPKVDKYKNKTEDGIVKFTSRFYPSDYSCILYTFGILADDRFKKSIIKYISEIIKIKYKKNGSTSTKEYINAIAKGLNMLTYDDTRIDHSKLIDKFNDRTEIIEKRLDTIKSWLKGKCPGELDNNTKFNSSKRLWCSLRDYIKNPLFKEHFKSAIEKEISNSNNQIFDDFFKKVLKDNKGCKYIELPGDVWNDKPIFRDCFHKNDKNQKNRKGKLGKVLREKCGWKEENEWYPEQFDVTFDLVPRMCEKSNCNYCILNEKLDSNEINKLCHEVPEKYCPIMLLHCGYFVKCNGKDSCAIYESLSKN